MKKINKNNFGFTLVEMLVVLAVVSVLITMVVYSSKQYIGKGKDATIKGNLAILITAGEVWYDKNNNSYDGFCASSVAAKSLNEISSADKYCNEAVNDRSWAACASEFVDDTIAFCVDSKGNQKEISNHDCDNNITNCCIGNPPGCIN